MHVVKCVGVVKAGPACSGLRCFFDWPGARAGWRGYRGNGSPAGFSVVFAL